MKLGIAQPHGRWLERSIPDPAANVALDEILLASIPAEPPTAILRFWENEPCIVVGRNYGREFLNDSVLPGIAIDGYPVVRRASGGEVVVHDEGALNISLLLSDVLQPDGIEASFRLFTRSAARGIEMTTGMAVAPARIPGSYCDGDFNLAYGSRKIGGTSQRRTRRATLVHATLNVSQDPGHIANLVNGLYRTIGENEQTSHSDYIAGLADICERPIKRRDLKDNLLTAFAQVLQESTGYDLEFERDVLTSFEEQQLQAKATWGNQERYPRSL